MYKENRSTWQGAFKLAKHILISLMNLNSDEKFGHFFAAMKNKNKRTGCYVAFKSKKTMCTSNRLHLIHKARAILKDARTCVLPKYYQQAFTSTYISTCH